jgi:UDP-GlcNAc:undecaprenyl-phosphate GlcNAc-1-phosphate transferase
MKQLLLDSAITSIAALVFALILIPLLAKISRPLGLIDKPGHRKIHAKPVPLVGGLSIVLSTGMASLLTQSGLALFTTHGVLVSACLVLFAIGVWDDRNNLKPIYRLAVQAVCAWAMAASGIRLTSLYGMFGFEGLNIYWQYGLTIVIITGVTNAFNLMDGIDGLAGGLALINITILSILSILLGQTALFVLLLGIGGALIGFLNYNVSKTKVFMGDGGSLTLGFLMASVGILLIESTRVVHTVNINYVVLLVSTILIIPVFDSLRVYVSRVQRGNSPFKADKTHLHHLFLIFGVKHKWAALYILGLEVIILVLGFLLGQFTTVSMSIIVVVALFLFVCQLLLLNKGVDKWKRLISEMESTY